jgi:hypothetical protein
MGQRMFFFWFPFSTAAASGIQPVDNCIGLRGLFIFFDIKSI